ncbi:MAG: sugar nucleotide-binding protein, partial [Deltaproteobacteria bacterium]|nr:sugar nucleotide-binding protein [Deltaproteobacteria bacterium]
RDFGSRLVRFSSDLVFDGCGDGGYVESAPVSPVTIYGQTMAEAEQIILEGLPSALVLRIPLPMGHSFNGHAGALDWIGSRFRKKLPATLYYDEVRSNIYIQDIIKVVEYLLDTSCSGLFHLGGPQALSLYQIAQIINRLGGFTADFLKGCFRNEAAPIPPRAGNVSMDCSKLYRLLPPNMIRPWPLNPKHLPGHATWHHKHKPEYSSRFMLQHLFGYDLEDEHHHPVHYLPQHILNRHNEVN